jgi:uncharacterized repeat protein (TIGR01451 family)
MKTGKYLLVVLMISASIFGMEERTIAQSLDLSKTVTNVTTSSPGTLAKEGDILEYTIVVRSLAAMNLTNTTVIDNIPAGTSYVAGSTRLNASTVPDASGQMPYTGSGGLVNSALRPAGTIAPGGTATVQFRVRVTANGGNITNYAMVECTNGASNIIQNTNTVFTNLTPDATCSVIYQSTARTTSGLPNDDQPYRYFKTVSTYNGTGGPILYNGETGLCRNALTNALLPSGSVLKYASAIAYDKKSNRIYFVNNYSNARQDLCYVDLNQTTKTAYRYVNHTMETTLQDGWNINRMAFASDGFGYAITQNGRDIIQFSVNPATNVPTITPLGELINDASNGSFDILAESGGDIFGDGSGNLYLIANSSRMYKINPNSKIATYLGGVNPFPASSSNAIAVDASGTVYIGGAYRNVYTVNLLTMAGSSITGGNTNNVWTTGDYTSCAFPVLAPALAANKTYRNINGSPIIVGGDTVEYRIEVINTGNINAAGVKLHDAIPNATLYIPGTTRLNGILLADDPGPTMPYAVTGGREIHSPGEFNGIIRPGAANSAVLTFRAKVEPLALVCNQSRITLLDVNGNTIFINSNDPTLPGGGTQNPTCFFSDGTLPVRSIDLKAAIQHDRSQLTFTVKEEQDIDFYEVQYSPDGANFQAIGQVKAKGNTLGTHVYNYTDAVNTSAVNRFYRIRVVGIKGNDVTLSKIVRVSMQNLQQVQVQPNPFQSDLTVRMELRAAEQVRFRLIDISGKEVIRLNKQLARGEHSITIPVGSKISQGVYVIEILTSSDNNVYRQKLVRR